MYIVYSDNESQKKFLQQQFLQQSGCFAVPFQSVKSLQDLIGRTCIQFYKHNESIFIQKFKAFIQGIINLTFSFPLLRQVLTLSKKKDFMSQFYRSHFVAMNNIICQDQQEPSMFGNIDCDRSHMLITQQLQQTVLSYKTLEIFEMDTQPMITLQNWSESQQLDIPKRNFSDRDQKTSILKSERTTDTTSDEYCQVNHDQKGQFGMHTQKNMLGLMSPLKLQKCFQNNILSMFDKNIDKNKYQNDDKVDQSVQQFINSFKKQKGNGIVQMIINEQSLGKIARKQNKQRHERKKLEQQIYEKTKSQKSSDYNRNIKAILLNKKLRDRKSRSKNEKQVSPCKQPNPQINMKKKKICNIPSQGVLVKSKISRNGSVQKRPDKRTAIICQQQGQVSFAAVKSINK